MITEHRTADGASTDIAPARLCLASFEDGTVLLDLGSGAVYRLNPTATFIAEGLAHGERPPEIAQRLAALFRLSPTDSDKDVASVLTQIMQSLPKRSANPLTFRSQPDGFWLHWQGHPVCSIDRRGQVLTDRSQHSAVPLDPACGLLWAAPHVLWLQDRVVLHASAVATEAGVVAFCGPSGAGKTTLAHLLVRQGKPLVSEDLLVLAQVGDQPMVAVSAEPAIRRWVDAHAALLACQGHVRTDGLLQAIDGPKLPLCEVLFIRREAMTTPAIRQEPLGKAAALVVLLENSFAELGHPDLWHTVWEGNRHVAAGTRMARARIPDGLTLLAEAVADYSRMVK